MENNTSTVPTTPVVPTQTAAPINNKFNDILDKVKVLLKDTFAKVYSNKLIFWTLTGIFGFMLILTVVGIIYKASNSTTSKKTTTKPTATPTSGFSNTGSKIFDGLTLDEDNLHLTKDSLINYDIEQKRINPPEIDFDISF